MLFAKVCSSDKDNDFPPPSNKKGDITTPAPNPVNVGRTNTLYKFSDYPDGVKIYVGSKTKFYPIGGTIKFIDPNGKTHYNKLEDDTKYSLPEGDYIFSPASPKATGVEIWQ